VSNATAPAVASLAEVRMTVPSIRMRLPIIAFRANRSLLQELCVLIDNHPE